MRKIGIICLMICILLSSCALKSKRFTSSKNTEMIAMLSDPAIRKDFRSMKAIAMKANLERRDGKLTFSDADIRKLDAASASMVHRLKYDYHMTSSSYKIHTFIGKDQPGSCYQYYNSYNTNLMGKSCREFPQGFASCQLCDSFIKSIRSRKLGIAHATWWNDEKTVDLVDMFRLKNGDYVYMALEFSIT